MQWPPFAFLAILVFGFLSDVFDGIIARRLGVATDDLRSLDSCADTVYYLGVLCAAWILHRDLIEAAALPIALVVGLEAFRALFDRWRFGKVASYHAWSAKLFGLLLFIAAVAVFGWSRGGVLTVCMWWGVLSELEGLAMSCVLPTWQRDLAHFGRAWNIRQSALQRDKSEL